MSKSLYVIVVVIIVSDDALNTMNNHPALNFACLAAASWSERTNSRSHVLEVGPCPAQRVLTAGEANRH